MNFGTQPRSQLNEQGQLCIPSFPSGFSEYKSDDQRREKEPRVFSQAYWKPSQWPYLTHSLCARTFIHCVPEPYAISGKWNAQASPHHGVSVSHRPSLGMPEKWPNVWGEFLPQDLDSQGPFSWTKKPVWMGFWQSYLQSLAVERFIWP